MEVCVNGKKVSVPAGSSLSTLLQQLSLGSGKIAVELNREIVPRSQYDSLLLKDGDQLEVVQAIGGG